MRTEMVQQPGCKELSVEFSSPVNFKYTLFTKLCKSTAMHLVTLIHSLFEFLQRYARVTQRQILTCG